MAGNQAPDIGQLTRILTIAIAATLILAVAVGILFAIKMFTDDEDPDSSTPATTIPDQPAPVITPTYTEQIIDADNYEIQYDPGRIIRMPVDASANDSVKVVESFIPDDPTFTPAEFNNTVADYTLTTEYYQVLYQKKYTLLYNSSSIVVTVGKGPLIVGYEVSDFIVTSGSGTGSITNEKYTDSSSTTIEGLPNENPHHSFLDLTVTDNSTGEVVATGGFGRTYPSTEEQYLMIPMTGEFRIDMYGTGLDAELTILSGTVPENPGAIGIDPNMKNKYSLITKKASETETSPEGPEEKWY